MFQVEIFLLVTTFSVTLGYQRFRGPCCLNLCNVGILPQHYTGSPSRRSRLEGQFLLTATGNYVKHCLNIHSY